MQNSKFSKNEVLSSSPDWILNSGPRMHVDRQNGNESYTAFDSHEEDNNEDEFDAHGSLRTSRSQLQINEDYTLEFFRSIQQLELASREEALESIINLLRQSLYSEKKELLKTHLATIVRLSAECPFEDVTNRFEEFVTKEVALVDKTLVLPKTTAPSTFIRKSLFPAVNTPDETYRKIFVELFLQTGRVSHLHRLLAIHPSYFERFYAAFNFLMNESGPLPLDWRNYIAILASCRHKCKWLVNYQTQEFRLNGGTLKWLEGVDYIPKKLSNLLPLNQILVHQPWLLTKDHIALLVKGEDSWSIGELVHAILIICTFNALAGIVYGCGVTDEADWESVEGSTTETEEEDKGTVPSNIDETKKITELLKGGWEAADQPAEQQELFALAENVEASHQASKPKTEAGPFARFLSKFDLFHEDFDIKSKNYNIFRVHEWNWKEDGFELARRFLPGAAALLDEEFDHIYTMTYNMFNQNKNVDTFPFRRAIWQYVQRIKGMFHDDYNYQEVNILLNKSAKSYIKKITCYPETIQKVDFQDLGYELAPDEKVHVALLAVESSKQSSLLYGLHAIMKHMYSN
jgi:sestrin